MGQSALTGSSPGPEQAGREPAAVRAQRGDTLTSVRLPCLSLLSAPSVRSQHHWGERGAGTLHQTLNLLPSFPSLLPQHARPTPQEGSSQTDGTMGSRGPAEHTGSEACVRGKAMAPSGRGFQAAFWFPVASCEFSDQLTDLCSKISSSYRLKHTELSPTKCVSQPAVCAAA